MYVGTDAVEALYVGSDPVLRAFLGEEAVYVPSLDDLDFILAWWDPSDITTLFKDSAGTVPVEAANDPVGLMRDKLGSVHFSTPDASRPLWDGVNALIFNGTTSFMNHEAQPFPSGANPSQLFSIVRQDALAADATNRTILSYGNGTATGLRNLRRVVSGGVNRLGIAVGDGAAGVTANETTVNFSGVHTVRMAVGGTSTAFDIDEVPATPLSVIPNTGTLRTRLGANTGTTATALHHGKIGPTAIANPDSEAELAILRKYFASITLT